MKKFWGENWHLAYRKILSSYNILIFIEKIISVMRLDGENTSLKLADRPLKLADRGGETGRFAVFNLLKLIGINIRSFNEWEILVNFPL